MNARGDYSGDADTDTAGDAGGKVGGDDDLDTGGSGEAIVLEIICSGKAGADACGVVNAGGVEICFGGQAQCSLNILSS